MATPITTLRARARRLTRDAARGATAVVVALSMVMIMGAAALGFDVALLYNARQSVRAAIDAAAQAAAISLPTVSTATAKAATFAAANYSMVSLSNAASNIGQTVTGNLPNGYQYSAKIDLYCVVAESGGAPKTSQVSSMCGSTAVTTTTSQYCNGTVCALPCSTSCNSIAITYNLIVPFVFAPAIGFASGPTGAQTTVSCHGACGTVSSNPMNVVVMADRTPSMWGNLTNQNRDGTYTGGSNDNLNALKTGIESMLGIMTPSQQYVAFGAIHKSAADGSAAPLASGAKILTETTTTSTVPYCSKYNWNGSCKTWSSKTTTTTTPNDVFTGSWVPIGFSKDYQNTSSALYSNVANLTYSNLTTSGTNGTTATYFNNKLLSDSGTYSDSGTGTHLAAAMKGAAQYLFTNVDSDNMVPSLDDGTRAALDVTPRNVIIFETDGQPSEVLDNATSDSASALSLANGDDIGAGSNVTQGCKNLKTVAAAVKAAGVTIITIGFGDAATNTSSTCGSTIGSPGNLLAAAASPVSSTVPSTNDGCSTATARAKENSDGDFYFCAATAADLEDVFQAALGSVNGTTKFMSIAGLGG